MHDFAREMRNLGRKQARIMSGRARQTALARKQQYLGARVPKELRDKVIAKAESLGIPVSILIRNVLEEAFSGVVTNEGGGGRAHGMPESPVGDGRFPGVIGWEDITLNRKMQCSACRRGIDAGAVVMLGLGAPGEDHVILCEKCRADA
jgi:hypothetical protein